MKPSAYDSQSEEDKSHDAASSCGGHEPNRHFSLAKVGYGFQPHEFLHKLHTFHPRPSNKKVARHHASMILKDVFHVSKLPTNFDYSSSYNCTEMFTRISYVSQDQLTGQMVGHTKVIHSLYHHELPSDQVNKENKLTCSSLSKLTIQ